MRALPLSLALLLLLGSPLAASPRRSTVADRNTVEVRSARPRACLLARAARGTGAVCKSALRGARSAGRWMRAHPRETLAIGAGAAAMVATVFVAAPAVSAAVAEWLAPALGHTAATMIGTGVGGALASGSRSLLVHATPMVCRVDPWNPRQLGADVGMSTGFGFLGFAQAAALRCATGSLGVSGLTLFATNYLGLVGWELTKDYLQNRARSRVATDPKSFREIWKSALLMETASNLHRCIPGLGLETSFGAKIAGDLGGSIWWDRILNQRNRRGSARENPLHNALTE